MEIVLVYSTSMNSFHTRYVVLVLICLAVSQTLQYFIELMLSF